jgi:hypothetical protein
LTAVNATDEAAISAPTPSATTSSCVMIPSTRPKVMK